MKIERSLCTNLFFPDSRKSVESFRRMAAYVAARGISCLEFYCDGDRADDVGGILKDNGLAGVYIAVIPHKEKLLHLCATDDAMRGEALALARRSLDAANRIGVETVMFNSGRIEEGRVDAGMDALVRSFEAIFEYDARKGYGLKIELEPCDSRMDARQLVGPWRRTLELATRLNDLGLPLRLTMDTAHTAEEGEDFIEALKGVKPFCSHVHYANCRISDPSDPLYGDKHLGFADSDSVFPYQALEGLTARLDALYPGDEPLRIALEALCREDDPFAWFDQTCTNMRYLTR